ncbi:hypothetical protein F4859DRAFT_511535 [Xylaria cf. heliscus]|nr:hypothetical protein F4859DRAFT_511535 [Xylaria cf. heliscus]
MAVPRRYTTPDGYAYYIPTPPPPYTSRAAAAAEREPLLSSRHAQSHRVTGNPNAWRVTIAIIALHLVTGIYVLRFLVYHWGSVHVPPAPLPTYSVAIIGAGPAGIAAAQHLRNSHAARYFTITIYESRPVIGGALAIHDTNGSSVFPKNDQTQGAITAEDITGNALMWNNALFTQDSEKVLKDKVDFFELGSEQIGYYKDAVTKTASAVRPFKKTPMLMWLKLLWSYGSSVGRGDKLAQDGALRNTMLNAPLIPDVEQIFTSLGVSNSLKQKANDMLKSYGISVQYATDILEPQVQRAYGQSLNQVTGLTAMMAAAREESANAYGGGDLIARLQHIVQKIDVGVRTSTRVTGIQYLGVDERQPPWLIRHESTDGGGGESSFELFDKVIMAALDLDVQLENGDEPIPSLTTHYNVNATIVRASVGETDPFIPVHLTFFTSEARLSPWGQDDDQVLFLEAQNAAGMRELALVREVVSHHDFNTKVEYLYRVLSDRPVIKELQRHAEITWSYETKACIFMLVIKDSLIEKAYPVSFPLQRYPSFELPWAHGMWWTSVIQRAGTSIDLNWLAGKIVAQELVKEVTQK